MASSTPQAAVNALLKLPDSIDCCRPCNLLLKAAITALWSCSGEGEIKAGREKGIAPAVFSNLHLMLVYKARSSLEADLGGKDVADV